MNKKGTENTEYITIALGKPMACPENGKSSERGTLEKDTARQENSKRLLGGGSAWEIISCDFLNIMIEPVSPEMDSPG